MQLIQEVIFRLRIPGCSHKIQYTSMQFALSLIIQHMWQTS